ncbi:Tc toxin subunit A-related protein [Wolbachia endosymbiont (group A) of Cheilosia soror]|uniref:Tc toxin subunit A-related protein n=1 Tax=Wolbachia endosymbiont (group A) of Cheilosia soror TaxID=2953995 RepID=UPI002226F601|nr:neuraminidase-like domain-containing protein [Wolbachia endosymbiont (group A) of Cheilosia soror]
MHIPKIFNTDNYNQCESCQSVLSPAAYLVKLLEIVNKYICPPELLKERRPDLYCIKLDCDNTNKEKLYLEIVNEIMEEKLKHDLGNDVLSKLATAKYPFNLPANFPLMSIRAYLKKHKTSLAEIYKILIANADTDAEFSSLSPEEYEVITSDNETEAYLREVYGITEGEINQLNNVDKFIVQTGIEHDKLQPLLDSYNKIKGSITLTITGQTIDERKEQVINNLDNQALSFLHRFIRLANKLNWSFDELTQALSEGKIDQKKIAKIKNLHEKFQQPLAKIFALYADSLPEGISNKIDSLPEFKALLSQKSLKDLAATASNYSTLQNILGVNSNELTSLINYHNDQEVFGEKILKVYKQVLLARLVNIPIAELLSQLKIEGVNQDNVVEFNDWLTKHAITTEQIRRLIDPASSKQLAEQLHNSVQGVKDQQSFYNEVYKFVGNIQPEILDAIYTFTADPENPQSFSDRGFLEKFLHNIDVFTTLKFEVESIANYKSAYGGQETWSIEQIKTLANYRTLKGLYSKLPGYISWLYGNDYKSDKIIEKMVQLTGWNQDTLEAIKEVKIFRPCFEKQDPVGSLMKIKPLMDIKEINIKILLKLKDLYNLKVSNGWNKYTDVARDLELITEKDEGYLAREKRDILARYMIHINQDLKNMRDLYGFLLMDVEMSECSKISPIKAALNSVQLYIHRAMMKIEEGIKVDEKFTEEKWKWLSSYREWEASNKIKLYPENYLNPTLRKIVAPEYKKLQNTLMQGNITDEGVSDAYMKYFEDFEQVTSLKIVDSCFERVDKKNTLYVIGRTLAQPYDYYYRTAVFDEENQKILYWTAWEKIEASIPVETVTPIYAFNRLFIFWVQQIEKGKDNEKRIDAMINYIFQKPSGSWTAPQKLASDIKIDPVDEAKKLYWKKVAVFYLKEQGGEERRIVVIIGETKFDSESPSNLFTLDEDLVASENQKGKFINNFPYKTCTVDLKKKFDPLPFSSKAVIGNKVIFFGGKIDDDQYSSQVNIYDNETGERSPHTVGEGRIFVPVAVVGKKAIFFGGQNKDGYSSKIDIYDDKTKEWTNCLMKGNPFYRSDATVVGNKAVFFCTSQSPEIDIYDGETGGWTTHTASGTRHNPAVAVVGKKAIFFGGEKFYNPSPKVDIYDDETGEWTPHITSEARKGAAVAVVGKKAIFFGGMGEGGYSSKIDIYDAVTGGWTTHIASEARMNVAVAVVGKKAIFFSGDAGDISVYDHPSQIDIYDDEAIDKKWSTHSISKERTYVAVAVVGKKAIFFGGLGSKKIDIYNGETKSWITCAGGQESTTFQKSVVVGRKAIFFDKFDALKMDIYDDETDVWTAITTKIKRVDSHIIQGNKVTFIGSDENENMLKYEILGDKIQYSSYDVIDNSGKLNLGETKNIFETNVTNKEGNATPLYENDPTKQLTLLNNFKKSLAQQVINKPGWFIVEGNLERENIRESFLLLPKDYNLSAISEQSTYKVNKDENKLEFEYIGETQKSNFQDMKLSFMRLNITGNVRDLRQKAYAGGPKSILTLESQKVEQLPFTRFNPTDSVSPRPSDLLDFSGAYGLYLWEIFFHIPMLVAWHLHKEQDFATARKWYQYIFNPTNDKAWQFLPFEEHNSDNIVASLSDTQTTTELAIDPFDPYTIAKQHVTSFEKYIIISYVNNLIDWGDMLFAKGSWEALNQATMLYIRAWDLLGPKPIKKGNFSVQPQSFNELKPHDLLQLETELPCGSQLTVQSDEAHDLIKYSNYFCTPENKSFIGLWDKVEDRLYKIRHCLDMGGKKAVPPLFQPPLNPKQLSAVTGGHSVELPQIHLPHYRFSQMVSYAKSIVETVMQFGSELLDVLEKRDAELLTILYNKQEGIISNLISSIKERTIEALKKEKDALSASLNSAEERRSHYDNLINAGLSGHEVEGILSYSEATLTRLGACGAYGTAAAAYWIPTIFGLANGGCQPGSSIEAGANSATTLADIKKEGGELSNIIASYQRRAEDWDLQKKLATCDVKQINHTIEANQINQAIAEQELKVHKESIKQNQEKREFFESKFTSKELYDWIKGQIAIIYFQAYKMALEMVKQVEKTYQYELNNDRVFITASSWNSLKEGLLAGHSLKFALEQMTKEYLDNNERALEITKTMPLSPIAINDLKTKGSCKFALTEKTFDLDFPGHYCRKIKSIRITIRAEVAPYYQDIHATLQQTGNRVVLKPDIEAIKSLLGENDESNESIRVNWKTGQQIAISKGNQAESGLFELNFNDERYLPFEGTGAVSDWILKLRNATKVSDVIVHLDYTAFDGGKELCDKVKALPKLKYYYDMLAVKLSEFDQEEWQRFKQSSEFKFKPTFPAEIKNPEIDLSYNGIYLIPKISDESQVDIKLGSNVLDRNTHKVTVTQLESDWVIKSTNADKIEEIMVIIPYKAEVN